MMNANKNRLSCQEVVELVTDYLDQALLPEAQSQFEEHVATCPGCKTFLDQVQQTIDLLRTLSEQQAFPETKQDLLEVFRNWKQHEGTGDSPLE